MLCKPHSIADYQCVFFSVILLKNTCLCFSLYHRGRWMWTVKWVGKWRNEYKRQDWELEEAYMSQACSLCGCYCCCRFFFFPSTLLPGEVLLPHRSCLLLLRPVSQLRSVPHRWTIARHPQGKSQIVKLRSLIGYSEKNTPYYCWINSMVLSDVSSDSTY